MTAVASEEGAQRLRSVDPLVQPLGVLEHTDHGGFSHVQRALRRLRELFPGRKWYMKLDDDAFLYPSNLLHLLEYLGANHSELVAYGNTLTPGGQFVSGGAGYVLSAAAVDAVLANEAACFGPQWPAGTNEDIVVSTCLRELGARFVHGHGFYMSPPGEAFTSWRHHHWNGEAVFPVTFHWLKSATPKHCLACACVQVSSST